MSRVSLVKSGQGIQVGDTTRASVTSATIANGSYTAGNDVLVTLAFSEAILTSTGFNATVRLNVGGVERTATYVAAGSAASGVTGETANKLVFRYTVQSGEVDTDGIAIVANSLTILNGGTVTDRAATPNTSTGTDFNFAASTNTAAVIPAPTVTTPTIAIAAIADANLSLAEAQAFALSGTASNVNGQTVTVTFADTNSETADVTRTTTVSGGSWALTEIDLADEGLSDGTITITASVGTAAPATRSVTLDTVAPDAADVDTIAGDGTVNIEEAAAGFTITGTAEAGSTVTITDGEDSTIDTALVDSNGNWSIAIDAGEVDAGDEELVTLTVTVTDTAGNATSTQTQLFIDTLAPDAADVDPIAGDNTVNIAEANAGFAITGTAEAGSEITITDEEDTLLGTATAGENGEWSIAIDAGEVELGLEETGTLTVTVTDAAGNATDTTVDVVTDTIAPNGAFTDTIADDGIVNIAEANAGFDITGTAEIGSTVVLKNEAGTVIGTDVADDEGLWSIAVAEDDVDAMGEGPETLTVVSTDAAGNASSTTPEITVDTIAPTAPIIDTVAADDTINAFESEGLDVTGEAEIGSTVVLKNGAGAVIGTDVADGEGVWSIEVSENDLDAMGQGDETLTVVATDAAGNAGTAATREITIDTIAPVTPTIDAVTGEDDTISSTEANAGFDITGTAEADSTVVLKNGAGTVIGTVVADDEGLWSIAVDRGDVDAMGDGPERLTVVSTDAAGNFSSATRDITVEASDAPLIADQSTAVDEEDGDFTFNVQAIAQDGFEIASYEITGGNTGDVFAIDGEGVLSLNRPLEADGVEPDPATYTLTVKVTNAVLVDEEPEFSTATITVALNDLNDNSPVFASSSKATVSEAATVGATVIDVDATDADRSSAFNTLTYSIVSGNTGSAFAINATTGLITVNKALDFETTPSYTLEVEATDGTNSETQNITVSLSDVNEAPTVTQDQIVVENDGSTVTITSDNLAALDPEGQAITFTFTTIPSNGVLFFDDEIYGGGTLAVTAQNIADGRLTFRGDDNGTATLSLTASDGTNSVPVSFSIEVLPTNSAPQVLNFETNKSTLGPLAFTEDQAAVQVDSTLAVVDSNTTNFSGGFLTVQSTDADDVIGLVAGTKLGVVGTTVTYDADGAGAGVAVTIGTITTGEGLLRVDFTGTTVSRAAALEVAQSVTFFNDEDGLSAGVTENRTLTYTLNDGEAIPKEGTATALVTITGTNDAPVAIDDTAEAAEAGGTANDTAGTAPTGNVLTDGDVNDSDVDADDILVVVNAASVTADGDLVEIDGNTPVEGEYGTLVIAADGSYTYTIDDEDDAVQALNAGGTLVETFSYTVSDGSDLENGTDTATLTITINGANDAPVNTLGDTSQVVAQDTNLAFNTDGENGISVADVDNTTLTVALSVEQGSLTINTTAVTVVDGDGTDGTLKIFGTVAALNTALQTLVYKGDDGYNGADTLTIVTTDGGTLTDTDTVAITVSAKPVNAIDTDAIFGGAYQGAEGAVIDLAGLSFSDNDAEGTDIFTVTLGVTLGTGTISVNDDGTLNAITGALTETVTLEGTYSALQTYLAGSSNLSFVANAGYYGASTLTMTTSDGGLSDTDTYDITVVPVSTDYFFNAGTGELVRNEPTVGDGGSEIEADTISGFGSTALGVGGIDGTDTLTIIDGSAADAVVTVDSSTNGNTVLDFGDGNVLTLAGFNGPIAAGRIAFDDGSLLVTNTGGSSASLAGGSGRDQLMAGDNGDTLRGGAGNDKLVGGDARDYLYDGAGADTVYGGGGSDVIVSGRGNDTLDGGTEADGADGEADFFVYSGRTGAPSVGQDTIQNFEQGTDKIVLLDVANVIASMFLIDVDGEGPIIATIDNSGDDAIVSLNSGTQITVLGVDLTHTDFRGSSVFALT
jgi:VCBS repeat-containing protein